VNEDDVLLQDMERAIPELERRLMRRMSVHEGLILIREDDTRFYVLPANSPWLVRCTSSDVSVSLGTALSTSVWEEGLGIDRGIDIELAAPYHTPENCSALALELGKRLKSMLQESVQPAGVGVR
jgi:hypothetical protein